MKPGDSEAVTPGAERLIKDRSWMPSPLRPYEPLIINAALTGIVPMPERVPHVPIAPEQIIRDAIACADAGASIVHLHARDGDGQPEWRRSAYEAIIPAIRAQRPEVVICVTTSGRRFRELEQRADVLKLSGEAKPDMASLTLGSLNFGNETSTNSPATILSLAKAMAEAGIKPELEVFDTGMAYLAHRLLDRGALAPPLYANLLLGAPNTAPARAGDLAHLVDSLPDGTVWAAGGIGAFQLPMNAIAVFMGGHVRTGLEDNPYYDFAERSPATNRSLTTRVAELAELAGRSIESPAQVRAKLGLQWAAPGRHTFHTHQ